MTLDLGDGETWQGNVTFTESGNTCATAWNMSLNGQLVISDAARRVGSDACADAGADASSD